MSKQGRSITFIAGRLLSGFATAQAEVRDFGLILSLFLALLAVLALFKARENLVSPLLLGSALICGLALLWPLPLWPVQRGAMLFARAMGWFNTRVLLGLVYYLVFTPMAAVLRLLRKDLLDRKWDPERSSYWQDRPELEEDPARDEKQF